MLHIGGEAGLKVLVRKAQSLTALKGKKLRGEKWHVLLMQSFQQAQTYCSNVRLRSFLTTHAILMSSQEAHFGRLPTQRPLEGDALEPASAAPVNLSKVSPVSFFGGSEGQKLRGELFGIDDLLVHPYMNIGLLLNGVFFLSFWAERLERRLRMIPMSFTLKACRMLW